MCRFLIFSILVTVALGAHGGPIPLDLGKPKDGVKILQEHAAEPDTKGVMETFKLSLPAFRRGVYYRGQWWLYAGNRVTARQITSPVGDEGGIFLLLELAGGGYLAVLPLSGDQACSWLAPDGTDFILKFGTHGKAAINGDFPLVAWARGANHYEACAKVWRSATATLQIKGHMKLREGKGYPEMFRYPGWCSWEEFHTLRIRGRRFQAKVFKAGTYSLGVGEPGTDAWKVFRGLGATPDAGAETLRVDNG